MECLILHYSITPGGILTFFVNIFKIDNEKNVNIMSYRTLYNFRISIGQEPYIYLCKYTEQ